jgi:MtN3 and saliva related transmembrane protein
MTFTDILGYSAGAITSLTFLPQVIKTWKEKSAKDVALNMFLIAAINEVMWIVYGVLLNNWVIILTNSIVLSMSLIMIFLKLKYSGNLPVGDDLLKNKNN